MQNCAYKVHIETEPEPKITIKRLPFENNDSINSTFDQNVPNKVYSKQKDHDFWTICDTQGNLFEVRCTIDEDK